MSATWAARADGWNRVWSAIGAQKERFSCINAGWRRKLRAMRAEGVLMRPLGDVDCRDASFGDRTFFADGLESSFTMRECN